MTFDMHAYLARIGYAGSLEPTAGCLGALHLAHVTSIPFENIDIHIGRPIRLDLESLQDKLVRARRGGYCFENNSLFAAALEETGFAVTRLAARVHGGTGGRTHMVLRVEADGTSWLADVGFGGGSILQPIAFEPGPVVEQFGWRFRLADVEGGRELQALRPDGWLGYYVFTLEPQLPIDYEIANHYTSTHPDSLFVRTLTAQLSSPDRAWILRGHTLIEMTPSGETVSGVSDDEMLSLLAKRFTIELPEGTRLPERKRRSRS